MKRLSLILAAAALLPPGNVKVRFFVPQDKLATLAIGQKVAIGCDGCGTPIEASVSFVAPQAEFTPPVIYAIESRKKLVYLVKAKPAAAVPDDDPDGDES